MTSRTFAKVPSTGRYIELGVKLATQVVEVQKRGATFKGLITKRRNGHAKTSAWAVMDNGELLVWAARGAASLALDLLGRS
jgi:hypothetical protein